MIYNRFYIAVIFQAALFAVLAYLAIWAQSQEHLKFTGIGFALMAFGSLAILVVVVTGHNRRIIRFLKSFIINEPYPNFRGAFKDKTFLQIEQELNRIADSYSQVKLAKEAQEHLLNYIIGHIDTAIFVIDKDGQIVIYNQSFDKYFPGKNINKISDLKKDYEGLFDTAVSLKPGQSKVVSILHKDEISKFLIKMSSFELKGSSMKLFSLDNVTGEMTKAEDMNWQKLLRILRHEIMNSVTPITSLTSNLIETIEENEFKEKVAVGEKSDTDNFYRGLKAIDKRSKGLLSFVKSYKSLIEIPDPALESIRLGPVFDHLSTLYKEDLEKDQVRLILECDESLELETNEELLTQVLVNLVRNAHESMLQSAGDKALKLTAVGLSGKVRVEVSDNGPGISNENLDQIFIPFFTTKEKGAGVGLSLSRQIVNRLGGTISVRSIPGVTVFTLVFSS